MEHWKNGTGKLQCGDAMLTGCQGPGKGAVPVTGKPPGSPLPKPAGVFAFFFEVDGVVLP